MNKERIIRFLTDELDRPQPKKEKVAKIFELIDKREKKYHDQLADLEIRIDKLAKKNSELQRNNHNQK